MGETKNTEEKIEELCQSIFGKSTKDIKYLYVTNYIHKQLMDEELARTGLYQWQNVFNGEVKYPRDVSDYSKYDIVHVNMSTQDIPLIKDIEESLTDEQRKHTKIIVNNDYTTESWGNSFLSPNSLAREIRDVDMIFGTEYYQTTALTELTGRTCYVIPHPADIRRLKSLPQIPKKELIPGTKEEEIIIALLKNSKAMYIDRIIQESGLNPAKVSATLTNLEMLEKIKNLGGQVYVISK